MTRPQYRDIKSMFHSRSESVDDLHHKDDRDGAESGTTDYSREEKGKFLVCITFVLEAIILAAVIVLECFLRYLQEFLGIIIMLS